MSIFKQMVKQEVICGYMSEEIVKYLKEHLSVLRNPATKEAEEQLFFLKFYHSIGNYNCKIYNAPDCPANIQINNGYVTIPPYGAVNGESCYQRIINGMKVKDVEGGELWKEWQKQIKESLPYVLDNIEHKGKLST